MLADLQAAIAANKARATTVGAAIILAVVTIGGVLLQPGQYVFLETFDGTPTSPQPFANPNSWDIFPTGLDSQEVGIAPLAQVGHHGPNCERPPAAVPYTAANTHDLKTTADTVFNCNGHLMTAPGLSGYGAIYMVPPAMADFRSGTSKVTFEMSTLRTSSRDFVYFTFAPFDGHNKLAFNQNDQQVPPNMVNVHIAGTNAFYACQRVNGNPTGTGGNCGADREVTGPLVDTSTQWDAVQSANGVGPDSARRDLFTIELSATHLRVCITGNNTGQKYTYPNPGGTAGAGFCWIDANLPTALDPNIWHGNAVVMISHVSYNPEKSCSAVDDATGIVHNPQGDAQCPPNTWHWDNVGIAPAVPFTILNPQQLYPQFNDPNGANTVTFSMPAPANAHLSYFGLGECAGQRFSIDGGTTWITSIPQPTLTQCAHPENGGEYWTPIPQGATSVKFTGTPGFGQWSAGGIAIWAPTAGGVTSTATPTPTPTSSTGVPTPTRTASSSPRPTSSSSPTTVPTASPTQSATASPTPTSTSTASPSPACEAMVRVGGVVLWAPQPSAFCAGAHP